MPLQVPGKGLTLDENYRRFVLAFQTIDAAVLNIAAAQTAIGEESARWRQAIGLANAAVTVEQLRRQEAIGAVNEAVTVETVRREQAVAAANEATLQEQVRREQAVAVVYEALAQQFTRLSGAIAAGDAAQAQALAEAVTRLLASLDTKADAADVSALASRADVQASRPGAAPLQFTVAMKAADLGGGRDALPTLAARYQGGGENGPVARMSGAVILASRQAFALEAGRQYRARWVVQRRTNPADPAGDTVRCGLVYLDQSLRVLGDVVRIQDFPRLLSANGRQERQALISRTPGLSGAFPAPNGARFAVPVVQFFGPDHVTDVEVLTLDDVTNAAVLSTPTAQFEARLSAVESGDVPARVEVLEAAANTPSKATYRTKGDATAATIAGTVQVVEILGGQAAGDGRGGLYARTGGAVPPDADSFTSHGALFVRVPIVPEIAAATLLAGAATFMGALPGARPEQAGQVWNNGGLLSVGSPAPTFASLRLTAGLSAATAEVARTLTVGGTLAFDGVNGIIAGIAGLNVEGKGDSRLYVRPAFNLDTGVVFYSASKDFSTPRGLEVVADRLLVNAQRGVTILPKANSLERALNVVQSGPASGSVAGPVILNGFDVSWSSGLTGAYGTPGLVGAAALAAFQVSLNVGGPNLAGTQFIALSAGITHDRNDASDGDKFAISGGVHSTARTNGLLDGACFSVVVDSGSYTPQAAGTEVDMAILGTGRTPNRLGFVAVNTGSRTAERADIAYAATSAGPDGTIGGSWKTLLGLYKQSTTLPAAMQPTGRIFEADHDLTMADGLYMPNITFTGDILRSKHARLRGDGVLALGDVEPSLTSFGWLHVQSSSASRASLVLEPGEAPDAAHTRVGQIYSTGAALFLVDNQGQHRRLAFDN